MLSIRNMKADDWEEVSRLDILAFNYHLKKTGRETRIHHRTQANLMASMALYPDGCFVAETDKMVGYIFSRVWGKLGWIGTFGVNPDCHGRGIGQKLLIRTIERLEQAGCTTIGLETMPDSPYNVGFYTKMGFTPTYPTLHLSKTSKSITSTPSFGLLSEVNGQEAFACITSLSHTGSKQVDYVVEAHNAEKYGWGDTLLFGWPQPYGFAVIRTISTLQGSSQPICGVICAVLEPKSRNRLSEVLELLQSYAYEKKASQITLPVNAIDSGALQEVIRSGFQVDRIRLRMIYQGEYLCPEGIEMSRWTM
jgi:ribosomal protein S18 acetylase RimI-like enzyme